MWFLPPRGALWSSSSSSSSSRSSSSRSSSSSSSSSRSSSSSSSSSTSSSGSSKLIRFGRVQIDGQKQAKSRILARKRGSLIAEVRL